MSVGIEKMCMHCVEYNCQVSDTGLHGPRVLREKFDYLPPPKEVEKSPTAHDANQRPYLKADGSDFHDPLWAPQKRESFSKTCLICGYHGSWGSPHRSRPDGNYERLDHGTLILMVKGSDD